MVVMNLQSLCMQNMVEMIKNLPPLLRDEVIGESTKAIKKEAEENAKNKIIKDIRQSASIIEDITKYLIESYRTGHDWKLPECRYDIDKELYNTFVNISERIVMKNYEVFMFNAPFGVQYPHRESANALWDEGTSSDEDYTDDEY